MSTMYFRNRLLLAFFLASQSIVLASPLISRAEAHAYDLAHPPPVGYEPLQSWKLFPLPDGVLVWLALWCVDVGNDSVQVVSFLRTGQYWFSCICTFFILFTLVIQFHSGDVWNTAKKSIARGFSTAD